MAGACVFGEAGILIDDVVNTVPVSLDVAGGAPQVAAHWRRPLPRCIPAILAKRVNDGAAAGLERLAHLVVSRDHEPHLLGLVVGSLLGHHFLAEAAQVVLRSEEHTSELQSPCNL